MSDQTNETKTKVGRPRKEIDRTQFEKLCGLQCTQAEIASYFDCSEDTIDRWCKREYQAYFAEVFKIKRGTGCISLRRMQMQLAEKSAAMAIFLGKNYLGQKDVIETVSDENVKDDGFLQALEGSASEDWKEIEDGEDQNE